VAVIVPFETPSKPASDPLVDLLTPDMERVNAVILTRTGSDVTMIPEVANHLINSGGKRLRPMLTLALARLTGYAGESHIKLAAAVEFMHTATLLHDDVVDESELRRGRLAARMLWGNEASVLVGDFLLGQAFKMMVEVGSLKALEILSSAAAVIAEGEVMQLAAAKNTATTEDEYIAVIRAKTAELFAAACEVGPVLSGRQRDEQAACRSFGMNLGIAFQLIDDVLDYGGAAAKLGKKVGDDFREGKITLPVVLAFRRGADSEREFWRRTLERGEASDADLEHAIGLMSKHRALDDTIGRAHHYGAIARDALALTRRSQSIVRRIHQFGKLPRSAFAAFCAAAAEAKSAKQVAPEPDMRAILHPTLLRKTARTSAITGASAIAGRSRSLVCASRNSNSASRVGGDPSAANPAFGDGADAVAQPANTSLVATATPGLTSTAASVGKVRGSERMSPIPRMIRGRESRHTGTSAPAARAAA
jgi:octaprenyl-diphosphate synthase